MSRDQIGDAGASSATWEQVGQVLLSILFVILLGSVLVLVVGAASGRLPGQSPPPTSWPSFDGDRVEVTP